MSAGFPTGQSIQERAAYPRNRADEANGHQAQRAQRASKGGSIASWR